MTKQKIIVFMPAHNEEENISGVIARVPRDFHPQYEVEVLVIDDGSKDRTVQVSARSGGRPHCVVPAQ